jgi:hypothetical protein
MNLVVEFWLLTRGLKRRLSSCRRVRSCPEGVYLLSPAPGRGGGSVGERGGPSPVPRREVGPGRGRQHFGGKQ